MNKERIVPIKPGIISRITTVPMAATKSERTLSRRGHENHITAKATNMASVPDRATESGIAAAIRITRSHARRLRSIGAYKA